MSAVRWIAAALVSMSALVAGRVEAREKGLQPTRRELSRLEPPSQELAPAPVAEPNAGNSRSPWPRWYGWQVLLVDAVSIGAFEAGVLSQEGGPAFLGLTTFLLGPPLVHLAHQEGWRTGASFGVRVAMPVLAGAITAGTNAKLSCGADRTEACEDDTRLNGALVFGAAMLVTSVVDSFGFAYRSPSPRSTANSKFSPTFVLLPRWESGAVSAGGSWPGHGRSGQSWGLTLAGTF